MASQTAEITNFLTRWKFQLSSNDQQMQIISLCEIVKMLSSVTPENKKKVISVFVNSDIIQFVSSIIQSNNRSLQIINKIVLNISEADNDEFYIFYFSVVFKSYIRALSFLLHNQFRKKDALVLKNVFNMLSILIQRASPRNIFHQSFNPLLSLLSIVDIFQKSSVKQLNHEYLMFINQTLEIQNASQSSVTDIRIQKLISQIKIEEQCSTDILLTTSKIIFNLLRYQRSLKVKSPIFGNQLIDFFLKLMVFTLETSDNYYNFDILLNMFYYVIIDDGISEVNKLVVLKFFFERDGLKIFINLFRTLDSNCHITKIKIKVLLAEIFSILLKQSNHQTTGISSRKLCYEVVLSCDFGCFREGLLIHEMDPSVLDENLLLVIIILQSIDAEYIKYYSKTEILINLSSIICVLDVKGISLNPSFENLVMKLFIENWQSINTTGHESGILKIASDYIIKLLSKNESLNLKALLFVQSTSLKAEQKEVLMKLYLSVPNVDYKELEQINWNAGDLLNQLFTKEISQVAHNNISKILSLKLLNINQYKTVMIKIRETLKEKDNIKEETICNLLCILKNIQKINYDMQFRNEVAGLMIDLMQIKNRLSCGINSYIMDINMFVLAKGFPLL